MSPARTRSRCVAPGCQQSAAGAALCDDHFYGRKPWETDRPQYAPRLCSVPECRRVHYARGWCAMHYQREQRRGPLGPLRTAPWNPYYADLPCPSCGSRATVPFDPRPERAGREPSTDLATCVACHHTWPSAPCSPTDAADPPGQRSVGGHGGGGRKSVRGVKAAAVASDKAQPGRANSRAGDAPAVTGTTGAA